MSNNSSIACQFWPNEPYKCYVVSVVEDISPSISLIGCLFILIVIWLFKKYVVFLQRLIIALALSGMLLSASFLIGNIYSHESSKANICYVQAFLLQYFMWSTLSWVIVITANMIFIVNGIDSKSYECRYHLFAWINSLIWASLPLIGNTYGYAGIWCWIKKEYPWYRFGVWYFPLLIVCVSLLIAYGYIFIHSRKMVRTYSTVYNKMEERANKKYREEVTQLLAYPLIYVVFTIPIFIYRVHEATNPDQEPLFVLVLATVVLYPAVGFCNAVAYAIYNKTIRELKWKKVKIAFHSKIFGDKFHVRSYSVEDIQPELFPNNASTIANNFVSTQNQKI